MLDELCAQLERAEMDLRSVGGGGKRLTLDTADASTVDDGELDVTSVTPGGVPGVLDEPVVEARVGIVAEADGEDGVVEGSATLGRVEDTGFVGLEDSLVGLDGDSEGLLGESGLHLARAVRGHGQVVRHGDSGGAALSISAAGLLTRSGGVGVNGIELSLVAIFIVGVGPLLETALAAVVFVALLETSTVDELLLREGEELTSGDVVGTLERAGSGEGPAGAALALILDGGDGTTINPVDGVSVGLLEEGRLLALTTASGVPKHGLVLSVAPVRELVVTSDPVGTRGVVLIDEVVDGAEVLEAGGKLLDVSDLTAEFGHVAHVVEVDGHGECLVCFLLL